MVEAGPLRLALIVPSFEQPQWVCDLAKGLAQEGDSALFVVVDPAVATPPVGQEGHGSSVKRVVFSALDRRDKARNPTSCDPSAVVDLRHCLDDQCFRAVPERDGGGIDAGIHLSGVPPAPSLLRDVRHGLISFAHTQGVPPDSPGAPEVFRGSAVLTFRLLLWRTGSATPMEVMRSTIRTDRLSVAATSRRFYRSLSRLLAARVRATAASHVGHLDATRDLTDGPAPLAPLSTLTVSAGLIRMGALRIRRAITSRRARADWKLGVVRLDAPGTPLDLDLAAAHRPTVLPPPDGFIWADPFPLRRADRTFIFHEEMAKDKTSPGHISLIELLPGNEAVRVGPILKAPYHLSYPFVFEWKGSLFMIPETEQNRTVEIHRCVKWPDHWALEAILLDQVSAVDSTIVEAGDRWWMFNTMNPERDTDWDTDLYLFHAPSPLGPWQPHRLNPVKSDVRNSRSAGRLFWRGGRLFRPAQDCAEAYGNATVLNEVRRLDEAGFHERPVGRIAPWSTRIAGTHTVNQLEELVVLDCKVRTEPGRRFPSRRV